MRFPTMLPFPDRTDAGRALAGMLQHYRDGGDIVVLALPRGGVPVAVEVAEALRARLDLMLVRKLGSPGHEELAMGAVASGGYMILNQQVVRDLDIPAALIEEEVALETNEIIRREHAYRGKRPPIALEHQCVILVDDGVATGASLRAAIAAVRGRHPARVVVAVPVAASDAVEILRREVDEVVCLAQPEPFMAIGQWYTDFSQLDDAQVQSMLQRHWREHRQPHGTESP